MSFSIINSDSRRSYSRYNRGLLAVTTISLAFVAVANFAVDPYNVTGLNLLRLTQTQLSERRNDRLVALARFNRRPRGVLIVGDSRAKNLLESYFEKDGLLVRNLGYGGGTVYEAIDTTWFAISRIRVTDVVFVISFNSWSEVDSNDLVSAATQLLNRPWEYYLNWDVFRTALANLAANLSGQTAIDVSPPMSRAAFWHHQLEYNAASYYARHERPDLLRRRFLELTSYCHSHGIRLLFVVPPTHRDLQALVGAFGLEAEREQFLGLLRESGDLMDFDVSSQLTDDERNFLDPFHTTPEVNEWLATQIVARLAIDKEDQH